MPGDFQYKGERPESDLASEGISTDTNDASDSALQNTNVAPICT